MPNQPVQPIAVKHLFPDLRAALLDVLEQTPADLWNAPTACAGWTVKDVTLHILGDDIGLLSRRRDGFMLRSGFDGWHDLVNWINMQNNLWVEAARRMSLPMLGALLRFTGEMLDDYITGIDLSLVGVPVSWAGSAPAPLWMDVAREYTEYWMHLQHICDVLSVSRLKDREHFHPVLDTFVRALPHTYRKVIAADGTVITLTITGEAGGSWHLLWEDCCAWHLYAETDLPAACVVTLPEDIAWRLFTKGMTPQDVLPHATVSGDSALAQPVFSMVSIIA